MTFDLLEHRMLDVGDKSSWTHLLLTNPLLTTTHATQHKLEHRILGIIKTVMLLKYSFGSL